MPLKLPDCFLARAVIGCRVHFAIPAAYYSPEWDAPWDRMAGIIDTGDAIEYGLLCLATSVYLYSSYYSWNNKYTHVLHSTYLIYVKDSTKK